MDEVESSQAILFWRDKCERTLFYEVAPPVCNSFYLRPWQQRDR